LLCSDAIAADVRSWGEADCVQFEEIAIDDGIPRGWRLFVGSDAKSDQRVREVFPSLSLYEGARLSCEGGIQHSRNQYFPFAPPRVWLEGGDEQTIVTANAIPLLYSGETPGLFELPAETVPSGRVSIEAKRGGNVVARRNIYFSDISLPVASQALWCDRFGKSVDDNQSSEAIVCGSSVRKQGPPFAAFFLPGLPATGRVLLLGAKPGQIASLRVESMPVDWEPVWAIPMRRRGTALFCGESISGAEPDGNQIEDRNRVERWADVLWAWRHRIDPPRHHTLAALWIRYQRRAKQL